MWSYDDGLHQETVSDGPVAVDRLLCADWSDSISFCERITKETVFEALEMIREQKPVDRILFVANNYGSHHANLTQRRADDLSIEFVFLALYSPTLNAIEALWKSLKRAISPEIHEDEDQFRAFVTQTFLRLSHRVSLAADWIEISSRTSTGCADHS